MKIFKHNLWILLILILSFIIRFFGALADPFLHPWDERYHALVSRNMIQNPLKPMLFNRVLTMDFDKYSWCCNHIWMHKPPLFMWQMALSMKIFEPNLLFMRLPSIILGTLSILLLYRIVLLTTNNIKIALISSLIFCFSNYHIKMISGMTGMDHNDIAHGFYILASVWSFFEYLKKPQKKWIIFIGIFSGGAILNKWLTGLLVYLGWGVYILMDIRSKKKIPTKEIQNILFSLIICSIIFIPWQLFINWKYPDLALYEREFTNRHLREVIEGNGGSVFYYFKNISILTGEIIWLFIPFGIYFSYRSATVSKIKNQIILVYILFTFFFFSFFVATKVLTYLYIIIPFCFLYISYTIDYISNKVNSRKFNILLILLVIFLSLNPIQFYHYFSIENSKRNNCIYNENIYKNIKKYISKDTKIIMNTNSFENIDIMFYHNDLIAFHWILPEKEFKHFEKKKYKIAIFTAHGNYKIPDYAKKYPFLEIIKIPLRNTE